MIKTATETGFGPLVLVTALMLTFWLSIGLELQSEHETPQQNATAVLAWAQSNCDSHLELAPRAARTHAEVLLQVAAAFDADARNRGLSAACASAIELSKPVAVKRG